MKKTFLWIAAGLLMLAIGAGSTYLWMSSPAAKKDAGPAGAINGVVQDSSGKVVKYWYDPMVPDQRFDKPGKSPFMDMQLVPKYAGDENADSGISIPSQTVQNLGIRLDIVSREALGDELAAVGRVEADERATYAVQTRVPGFVERLLVRAVGEPVSKNQKIAEVYAPELLAAQHEYLALLDMQQTGNLQDIREAARTRLKLLGMSDSEISRIARTGQSSPRIGIYAPASGVVAELGVREGAQLMAGSTLMQIADLSKVWVIAEVPERDAARMRIGMPATIELPASEPMHGEVAYIYPILDDTARALKARIELPNPQGHLRPGMYANVHFDQASDETLTVPSESIIATGRRKVVIVRDESGYRPAEVSTGRESKGKTEILGGLGEGEQIVVSGQFLIDSEASLSGVLARLSQQTGGVHSDHYMSSHEGHDTNAHESHDIAEKGAATSPVLPATGKVVNVAPEAARITLSHDPIPALKWPAMTMDFRVQDTQQLKDLHKGDEVEFSFGRDKGKYVIRDIHKRLRADSEHDAPVQHDPHIHHDHGGQP